MTYRYFACQVTTGQVLAELFPTAFSGERNLGSVGAMSCDLFLGNLNLADRVALIANTAPAKMSIAVDRNGVLMGEWIIWKRSRTNDDSPIKLGGTEIVSYLTHRLVKEQKLTEDQLLIAVEMARQGFMAQATDIWPGDGQVYGGAVQMSLPGPTLSGISQTVDYPHADSTYGQRLDELATMDHGFDYLVTQTWTAGTGSTVARTFRTAYPRAGVDTAETFQMAAPGGTGTIVGLAVDEDGANLADSCRELGTATGKDTNFRQQQVAQQGHLLVKTGGYPFLQFGESYINIPTNAALLAKAGATVQMKSTAWLPPTLTVLADGTPGLTDFRLGDRMAVAVPASTNFPTGYTGQIRLLGWTIAPPTDGSPEQVAVTVADAAL